ARARDDRTWIFVSRLEDRAGHSRQGKVAIGRSTSVTGAFRRSLIEWVAADDPVRNPSALHKDHLRGWDPLIVPTVNASPCAPSGRIVDDRDQGRGPLASHGPFLPRPHRPTLELMPDLVQEGLAPSRGEDHRVLPPKGKQTPPGSPAAHS